MAHREKFRECKYNLFQVGSIKLFLQFLTYLSTSSKNNNHTWKQESLSKANKETLCFCYHSYCGMHNHKKMYSFALNAHENLYTKQYPFTIWFVWFFISSDRPKAAFWGYNFSIFDSNQTPQQRIDSFHWQPHRDWSWAPHRSKSSPSKRLQINNHKAKSWQTPPWQKNQQFPQDVFALWGR